MSSLEKRHTSRQGSMQGHHKYSDGFSDTSSAGSFMDETDREVSNLTDRAFRSLCIGEEAIYNDSEFSSSPTERHKAFGEETQQKEILKRTTNETLSYSIQQYREAEVQSQVASTFQQSFVDVAQQEQALRTESLSYLSNGSTTWHQRRSTSRVSSLVKAFSTTDGYFDGGVPNEIITARDKYRDFNNGSWDKSALMSIQRELSELSSAYHQNFKSGPFQSYRNHFHSDVAAAVAQMDTTVSHMKSSKSKLIAPNKFKALNSTNFFLHSEFSPFQLWKDYNRFPFEREEVTGFISASEFPRWYESPLYKELTAAHRTPGSPTEGRRWNRKQIEDVSSTPRSRSTVMQKALAIEKRCESEMAVNYNPWRRNNNLVKNKMPGTRPSTVSPTNEKTRRPDTNLFSVSRVITQEVEHRVQKVVDNQTSSSVTPFNITQLLTPVIHTRQETETSEILQSAHTPSVSDFPLQNEVDAKPLLGVKQLRDSYKSKASSLLFNLKDNRKRVKSTYSPPKFKGLEVTDRNKQPSKLGLEQRHSATLSEIPVSQVTTQEYSMTTDTQTLCNQIQQPHVAPIAQSTEHKKYADAKGSYDDMTLTSPQSLDEASNYKRPAGTSPGNFLGPDQLANPGNDQNCISYMPSAQDKCIGVTRSENYICEIYRTASPTKREMGNVHSDAYQQSPNIHPETTVKYNVKDGISQNHLKERQSCLRTPNFAYSQVQAPGEKYPGEQALTLDNHSKEASSLNNNESSEAFQIKGEIAALIEMDKQRKATAKQYLPSNINNIGNERLVYNGNNDVKQGILSPAPKGEKREVLKSLDSHLYTEAWQNQPNYDNLMNKHHIYATKNEPLIKSNDQPIRDTFVSNENPYSKRTDLYGFQRNELQNKMSFTQKEARISMEDRSKETVRPESKVKPVVSDKVYEREPGQRAYYGSNPEPKRSRSEASMAYQPYKYEPGKQWHLAQANESRDIDAYTSKQLQPTAKTLQHTNINNYKSPVSSMLADQKAVNSVLASQKQVNTADKLLNAGEIECKLNDSFTPQQKHQFSSEKPVQDNNAKDSGNSGPTNYSSKSTREDRFSINDILTIRDHEHAKRERVRENKYSYVVSDPSKADNQISQTIEQKIAAIEASAVKEHDKTAQSKHDSFNNASVNKTIKPVSHFTLKDSQNTNEEYIQSENTGIDRKDKLKPNVINNKETDKIMQRSLKERGQTKQEILTSKLKAHAQKEISLIKEKGLAKQGLLLRNPPKPSPINENNEKEQNVTKEPEVPAVKKEITADKLNHLFKNVTYSSETSHEEHQNVARPHPRQMSLGPEEIKQSVETRHLQEADNATDTSKQNGLTRFNDLAMNQNETARAQLTNQKVQIEDRRGTTVDHKKPTKPETHESDRINVYQSTNSYIPSTEIKDHEDRALKRDAVKDTVIPEDMPSPVKPVKTEEKPSNNPTKINANSHLEQLKVPTENTEPQKYYSSRNTEIREDVPWKTSEKISPTDLHINRKVEQPSPLTTGKQNIMTVRKENIEHVNNNRGENIEQEVKPNGEPVIISDEAGASQVVSPSNSTGIPPVKLTEDANTSKNKNLLSQKELISEKARKFLKSPITDLVRTSHSKITAHTDEKAPVKMNEITTQHTYSLPETAGDNKLKNKQVKPWIKQESKANTINSDSEINQPPSHKDRENDSENALASKEPPNQANAPTNKEKCIQLNDINDSSPPAESKQVLRVKDEEEDRDGEQESSFLKQNAKGQEGALTKQQYDPEMNDKNVTVKTNQLPKQDGTSQDSTSQAQKDRDVSMQSEMLSKEDKDSEAQRIDGNNYDSQLKSKPEDNHSMELQQEKGCTLDMMTTEDKGQQIAKQSVLPNTSDDDSKDVSVSNTVHIPSGEDNATGDEPVIYSINISSKTDSTTEDEPMIYRIFVSSKQETSSRETGQGSGVLGDPVFPNETEETVNEISVIDENKRVEKVYPTTKENELKEAAKNMFSKKDDTEHELMGSKHNSTEVTDTQTHYRSSEKEQAEKESLPAKSVSPVKKEGEFLQKQHQQTDTEGEKDCARHNYSNEAPNFSSVPQMSVENNVSTTQKNVPEGSQNTHEQVTPNNTTCSKKVKEIEENVSGSEMEETHVSYDDNEQAALKCVVSSMAVPKYTNDKESASGDEKITINELVPLSKEKAFTSKPGVITEEPMDGRKAIVASKDNKRNDRTPVKENRQVDEKVPKLHAEKVQNLKEDEIQEDTQVKDGKAQVCTERCEKENQTAMNTKNTAVEDIEASVEGQRAERDKPVPSNQIGVAAFTKIPVRKDVEEVNISEPWNREKTMLLDHKKPQKEETEQSREVRGQDAISTVTSGKTALTKNQKVLCTSQGQDEQDMSKQGVLSKESATLEEKQQEGLPKRGKEYSLNEKPLPKHELNTFNTSPETKPRNDAVASRDEAPTTTDSQTVKETTLNHKAEGKKVPKKEISQKKDLMTVTGEQETYEHKNVENVYTKAATMSDNTNEKHNIQHVVNAEVKGQNMKQASSSLETQEDLLSMSEANTGKGKTAPQETGKITNEIPKTNKEVFKQALPMSTAEGDSRSVLNEESNLREAEEKNYVGEKSLKINGDNLKEEQAKMLNQGHMTSPNAALVKKDDENRSAIKDSRGEQIPLKQDNLQKSQSHVDKGFAPTTKEKVFAESNSYTSNSDSGVMRKDKVNSHVDNPLRGKKSSKPEISAIADYARLKVISAQDDSIDEKPILLPNMETYNSAVLASGDPKDSHRHVISPERVAEHKREVISSGMEKRQLEQGFTYRGQEKQTLSYHGSKVTEKTEKRQDQLYSMQGMHHPRHSELATTTMSADRHSRSLALKEREKITEEILRKHEHSHSVSASVWNEQQNQNLRTQGAMSQRPKRAVTPLSQSDSRSREHSWVRQPTDVKKSSVSQNVKQDTHQQSSSGSTHTMADRADNQAPPKERARDEEGMEEIQYYAVNALEDEPKLKDSHETSLRNEMTGKTPEGRTETPETRLSEESGAAKNTVDYGNVHNTRPRSNTSSPAMGKPTLFRVKDNTIKSLSVTKTVKPRFHRSVTEDSRVGSPNQNWSGSEKGEDEHDQSKDSVDHPVLHEPAVASQRLPRIREMPHHNTMTPTELTVTVKDLRSKFRRSLVLDDDETRSIFSTVSEDVESCAASTADVTDFRAAHMFETESYRDGYERPESACSFGDMRPLGKPPAVPPKTEKALRRAKKLTTRRIKKAEAKMTQENPGQLDSKPIRAVSSVPTSPVQIISAHQPVHASPPVPQFPTDHRYASSAPNIVAQPFSVTQRKLLQDPNSGQYYMVDMPVQVKTKTFYDPETGKYVQLSVRQRTPATLTQPQSVEVLNPHPYVLYPGFLPMSVSSLPPLRSSSQMSAPASVTEGKETPEPGHEQWRQDVYRHSYTPDTQQYVEPTYGSNEQIREEPWYSENKSNASNASNARHMDIIPMSELEDFAMEST